MIAIIMEGHTIIITLKIQVIGVQHNDQEIRIALTNFRGIPPIYIEEKLMNNCNLCRPVDDKIPDRTIQGWQCDAVKVGKGEPRRKSSQYLPTRHSGLLNSGVL